MSDEPQNCPECDVDIAPMDADQFARHMETAHPATYDLIRSVLASFQ